MKDALVIAAAASTGVFVGSTMVATRFVIDQTSPSALAFVRYLIGVLCLLPFFFRGPRPRFARGDLLPISLLGFAQFGIVIILLNFAVQYIPSARAALIFATVPLQTLLLGAVTGRERLSVPKTAGVLLTIVGVAFALGEKALVGGTSANSWLGELAMLGSAFSAAFCSLFYRQYVVKYTTVPVTTLAMFVAVLLLALFAAGDGFFAAFPSFTPLGWAAVLFIGVLSGIGNFLWMWALANTTPTRVTVFLALSPLTATVLGAVFLAEPVTLLSLLGLGCVALGLWLAHWQRGSALRRAAAASD